MGCEQRSACFLQHCVGQALVEEAGNGASSVGAHDYDGCPIVMINEAG